MIKERIRQACIGVCRMSHMGCITLSAMNVVSGMLKKSKPANVQSYISNGPFLAFLARESQNRHDFGPGLGLGLVGPDKGLVGLPYRPSPAAPDVSSKSSSSVGVGVGLEIL